MALGSHRLLIIGAVVVLQSCQQSTTDTAATTNAAAEESVSASVSHLPRQEGKPVRFSIGSTSFVAPDEVVGFHVTHQDQNVEFVTLGVLLPDFSEISGRYDADRANHVLISLERRDVTLAFISDTTAQAEKEFNRRYPDHTFGSSVNNKLGLLEIRFKEERDYVAYRRNDNYMRDNDGLIPTAVCPSPSSPTLCDGYGFVKPDINVKYRFSPSKLSQWPDIDQAVFNYIDEIRQDHDDAVE